jgi:8-oxo-dGTP pyrophosphatase MutT (NUDIX family)
LIPRPSSIGAVAAADAPGPGQDPAGPARPRPAASVILLRGGADALEVLLLHRSPSARFMPGAWVFPGGALDPGEEDPRAAAVRELAEEAGVEHVDPAALVPFSRWITPPEIPIRFDTHFFLAPLPAGAVARADGSEMTEAAWHAPEAALAAGRRGDLSLMFPTVKHLEQLTGFPSADALLAWASGREVTPVEPRVVGTGETARVVLPGEPGHPG